MSKRLQVILDDSEMKEIRTDPQRKLQALRVATSHSFPTADIEERKATAQ